MSQQYGTGACAWYLGIGAQFAPLFLGWSDGKSRKISNRPAWRPVYSDSHGTEIPADMSYQGQDAIVSSRFTRFNWNTVYALQEYAKRATVLGSPGLDGPGARGSLMLTEGLAYPMWITFPYSAKAAMRQAANGIMPLGRRYNTCYLMTDDMDEFGLAPTEFTFVWHALSLFTPSAAGGFHTLFSTNITGLPAPT